MLEILNLDGEVCYKRRLSSGTIESIDYDEKRFTRGVYFVKIQLESSILTRKLSVS